MVRFSAELARGLLYQQVSNTYKVRYTSTFLLYKSNHSFDEGGAVIIEVSPRVISWSFKY